LFIGFLTTKENEMKNTICLIGLFAIFLLIPTGLTYADDGLSGFISATIGSFNIKFPESGPAGESMGENVGFEDVYGSKRGLTYGIEGGIGNYSTGFFGVLKIRSWNKSGSPVIETIGDISMDATAKWSQYFVSSGGRYFFVSQMAKNDLTLPFIGCGLIYSRAKETLSGNISVPGQSEYFKVEAEVDGYGFYVEGGIDLFFSSNTTIRGTIEYSMLNLKGKTPDGTIVEIDGGGGLMFGLSLNYFLISRQK
jgi:hypothetical protein